MKNSFSELPSMVAQNKDQAQTQQASEIFQNNSQLPQDADDTMKKQASQMNADLYANEETNAEGKHEQASQKPSEKEKKKKKKTKKKDAEEKKKKDDEVSLDSVEKFYIELDKQKAKADRRIMIDDL
jgi:hypothetical protein